MAKSYIDWDNVIMSYIFICFSAGFLLIISGGLASLKGVVIAGAVMMLAAIIPLGVVAFLAFLAVLLFIPFFIYEAIRAVVSPRKESFFRQ